MNFTQGMGRVVEVKFHGVRDWMWIWAVGFLSQILTIPLKPLGTIFSLFFL